MNEYWYSDPETGFKTVFVAETEEEAEKQWKEFQRIRDCHRAGDFTALQH